MLKEGVSCTPSAALTSAPASVTGQELSDLDDFSPTDSPGHFSTTLASKALATDSQGLLKDGPGKQTWDRSPSVNSHALPGETGAARGLSSTAVVCPDHSPKYTHDHGYPSYSAIDYPIKRLRGSGQPVKDTFCLLSLEAQDYLLALFWDFYNSVIPLVHQRAFEEQRKQGLGRFYSTFLHICMLSIGYRYADKNRLDMQKIGQPTRENLLHKKAKAMLDFELEKPPTTPLIAALLLLGDLEWGVGRTKQAWLYGRMAAR
jgi:hypothetical protein